MHISRRAAVWFAVLFICLTLLVVLLNACSPHASPPDLPEVTPGVTAPDTEPPIGQDTDSGTDLPETQGDMEEVTTENLTIEETTTEEVTTEEVTTEEVTTEEVTTEEVTTEEVTTEEVTTEEVTTEEVTTEEVTTEEVTTEEVTTEELTTEEATTEEATTEEVTTEEVTTEEVTTEEVTTEEVTTEEIATETIPLYIPEEPADLGGDWKAIWISQFDLTLFYLDKGVQREREDFARLIAGMLDNVVNDGFNTVLLQLRPYGDSMYPSELFPPSLYCVGSYGGVFLYDPIEIIMELCAERGLAVHGWINPLRALSPEAIELVDDAYVIKQWYNDPEKRSRYLVEVENRWYLNPAYPEVRKLICDGVAEILCRYDMAGIHMDDYFYPTTDVSFDAVPYEEYLAEGGRLPLEDWRRLNLDKLVSELYATIKTADPHALFGIAPTGVLYTVYFTHYADVYKWCSTPGYIDYICPEIYFGFEHATCPFDEVSEAWQAIVTTEYVHYIVGLTFGKAVAGFDEWAGDVGGDEWTRHKDILLRSLRYTEGLDGCEGVTVFCYQHLFDLNTGEILEGSREEHEQFTAYFKEITWQDTIEPPSDPEQT